jgi:signal transduction histidine kinase
MEASQEIDFLMVLLPLVIVLLLIALGVIFMYQQFQKSIIHQQLTKEALKGTHQKELLHLVVKTQEEERKRIARDLHDELGAALSIGRMQLVQLENQKSIDPQQITPIRELMESTLASTRHISHQLMPLQLAQMGLERALHSLLDKVKQTGKVQPHIAIANNLGKLPWLLEIGLYRIYSELINNTLKHAKATRIEISIFKDSEQLFCRYTDNGTGLPEKTLNHGLGLQSLKSRVDIFEGKIQFGNQESGGFFTRIVIPLNI